MGWLRQKPTPREFQQDKSRAQKAEVWQESQGGSPRCENAFVAWVKRDPQQKEHPKPQFVMNERSMRRMKQ